MRPGALTREGAAEQALEAFDEVVSAPLIAAKAASPFASGRKGWAWKLWDQSGLTGHKPNARRYLSARDHDQIGARIAGRVFGFGTVDVHGTGVGAIHVKMIDDPVRLRREIQSAREQLKSKGE